MTNTVILDACVFNKMYLDEGDRDVVIEFFQYVKASNITLIAPSIFMYEVLAVAASSKYGAESAYELIQKLQKSGFQLVELEYNVVVQAITIANAGHDKSGFPTFYDSVYHGLALVCDGVFLTSDTRHIAKTASFGSVVALHEWKKYFAA